MALPANSSEVTLGARQDKSLYADWAKQPSAPQHTDTDRQYSGETVPAMHT